MNILRMSEQSRKIKKKWKLWILYTAKTQKKKVEIHFICLPRFAFFLLSSNLSHFFHFFIPVNDTEEYWWYWNIYTFFWRLIVSSLSIIYHFDCNSRWDICEESMNWNLIQRKIPFLEFFSLSFIRLFDLCRRSCKLTNDDFKIPKWWWWTWWWGLRGVFALLARVDDTQSDRNSSNEQNVNAMTLIILFLHRKFVDRIYTKESKEINDNKQPEPEKKGSTVESTWWKKYIQSANQRREVPSRRHGRANKFRHFSTLSCHHHRRRSSQINTNLFKAESSDHYDA